MPRLLSVSLTEQSVLDRTKSFFCDRMRCTPQTEVTRIEWEYIDAH